MSTRDLRAMALFLVFVLTTVGVSADDWVAQKLRGGVFTYIGDAWVQLARGDIVPDGQMVRTQNNGRVTLVRGSEIVDVGPSSQVEIVDRDGLQFTTVKQWSGTVEIEAEVRNVQHFAVVNQHLAAVVKGTRFTVKTSVNSASVDVTRGQVSVKDSATNETVEVPAGHSVTTSAEATLVLDAGPPAAASASPSFIASTSGQGGTIGGSGDNSESGGDGSTGHSGDNGNGNGQGNANSNDNNGSGPGNNGNGNAYGHENGNNGNGGGGGNGNAGGNGNGNAYGHNK